MSQVGKIIQINYIKIMHFIDAIIQRAQAFYQ